MFSETADVCRVRGVGMGKNESFLGRWQTVEWLVVCGYRVGWPEMRSWAKRLCLSIRQLAGSNRTRGSRLC